MEFHTVTGEGRKFQSLLQQLSKLYEQITLLLKTSDSRMQVKGWTLGGTNVFGGLSYTVANPRDWIPCSFFILYNNKKNPYVSAFISVILGGREKNLNDQEPLLTAGWFNYGSGYQIGKNFDYSWPHWRLRMPNRNDDGEILSVSDARKLWPKEPFTAVSTLGYL